MTDGINKDEGKLRLDLVSPEAIEAIARVAGQACETGKYPERNWEQGMLWMRQYASCMRHLMKWMKGEDLDEDTGLPHLEHALWRLAALVTYAKRRIGKDDRPDYPEEPDLSHWDTVIGWGEDKVSPVCPPDNHGLHVKMAQEIHRDLSDQEIQQQDEGRGYDGRYHPGHDQILLEAKAAWARQQARDMNQTQQSNPVPLPKPIPCAFGNPDCPICE